MAVLNLVHIGRALQFLNDLPQSTRAHCFAALSGQDINKAVHALSIMVRHFDDEQFSNTELSRVCEELTPFTTLVFQQFSLVGAVPTGFSEEISREQRTAPLSKRLEDAGIRLTSNMLADLQALLEEASKPSRMRDTELE